MSISCLFFSCAQVKQTIHQLKSRFEGSLQDRDEICERKLENQQKQFDKGKWDRVNEFLG